LPRDFGWINSLQCHPLRTLVLAIHHGNEFGAPGVREHAILLDSEDDGSIGTLALWSPWAITPASRRTEPRVDCIELLEEPE
jgi:hypothetical protein